MQLLILSLAHRRCGDIVTADEPDKLLRIYFVAVIAGILMRHRLAREIVGPQARLLC